ncbi:MAG: class I SAM-dependent methyltransferase [Anaerolineae bacterium]
MKHPDAHRWNERYMTDGDAWLASQPRQLLVEQAHWLPPGGLALDAAAGVAVHGRFLAKRGFHVIALDISEVGLRLARQDAQKKNLWLETAVYNLSHLWLPPNIFNVIINFRFLERGTFAVYRQALKPGGLLFFETFVRNDPEEEHPDYFLNPGELRAAFADWQILHWQEGVDGKCGKGYGRSPKVAAQLIARKP